MGQIGEMTFTGFAPQGTPAEAVEDLRAAYAAAAKDPEFIEKSMQMNGLPYEFVDVPRGKEIFASLAQVTPQVLATITKVIELK